MKEVVQTIVYAEWFAGIRDRRTRGRILSRVRRLSRGNAGDHLPVGNGVMEMRIHFGPGYRVYYVPHGSEIVVLLAGGDKNSQKWDIKRAIGLAKGLDGRTDL